MLAHYRHSADLTSYLLWAIFGRTVAVAGWKREGSVDATGQSDRVTYYQFPANHLPHRNRHHRRHHNLSPHPPVGGLGLNGVVSSLPSAVDQLSSHHHSPAGFPTIAIPLSISGIRRLLLPLRSCLRPQTGSVWRAKGPTGGRLAVRCPRCDLA
jgi:hypothetical protein